MLKRDRLVMIVGVLVVVGVLVYLCSCSSRKESFSNIGGIDNIGSLDQSSYKLTAEDSYSTPRFADIVDAGDHERIVRETELLPSLRRDTTTYNIDLADPAVHHYMPGGPRVVTAKTSKFKDYSLASHIRGDVPVKYHPDVPLISKTIQTIDKDLRTEALYAPHFVTLYDKYGHGFKNMPIVVGGMGGAGGYGGASSGVIMDGY